MKCKKCETETIEGAKYCHHCGMLVSKKYCFISESSDGNAILNRVQQELDQSNEEVLKLKKEKKELEEKVASLEQKGRTLVDEIQVVCRSSKFQNVGIGQTGPGGNYPNSVLTISTSGNIGIGSAAPSIWFTNGSTDSDLTIKTN